MRVRVPHRVHGRLCSFFDKCFEEGTCWIYSIIEEKSQRILKDDLYNWEQQGWIKGRKINFNKIICRGCGIEFIQKIKKHIVVRVVDIIRITTNNIAYLQQKGEEDGR